MLQAIIYNANSEKVGYLDKKSGIEAQKSAIEAQKSAVDKIKLAIEQQKYSEPTKENIFKVYDAIEEKQIFSTKEIEEILGCSSSTARAVMMKLRDMNIVDTIVGKGKGKYIFKADISI